MTETPSPSIEERLAALEVLSAVPVILGAGDVLIIRTTDLTPNMIREYQNALDYEHERGHCPFQAVVVHGDELAAARTAADPSLAAVESGTGLVSLDPPAPVPYAGPIRDADA